MEPGIYCIRNTTSGCVYIGASRDPKLRLDSHFSQLRSAKHHNARLTAAVIRDGIGAFDAQIIDQCSLDELALREQHWILQAKRAGLELYNASWGETMPPMRTKRPRAPAPEPALERVVKYPLPPPPPPPKPRRRCVPVDYAAMSRNAKAASERFARAMTIPLEERQRIISLKMAELRKK